MENYQTICSRLLAGLPDKPREILSRRFGLQKNQDPQTLQEIGAFLGLTRERVRQIESESLHKLGSVALAHKPARDLINSVKKNLQMAGGFKREDLLVSAMAKKEFRNCFLLILNLCPGIFRFSANKDFFAFWADDKTAAKKISPLLAKLAGFFNDLKTPTTKKDVYNLFAKQPQCLVDSLLEISQMVDIGPLGDVGLTVWPDIKPRGARDAAYLVLKNAKKPLHFKEIAQLSRTIDSEFFQRKKILTQTLHNELIKDPQFILVGRGIYSLRNWGYASGTVKDVIADVLKESSGPLTREQISQKVSSRKIIQPNTIFLNLANKRHFTRDNQGRYTLKEI